MLIWVRKYNGPLLQYKHYIYLLDKYCSSLTGDSTKTWESYRARVLPNPYKG